jgi:general secretion pathway protein C
MPSWTLNVVLFAVGCLLAADTAKEVVAATLLAPSSERSVARPSSSPAVRERSWADRQVILDRNLFAGTLEPPPPLQQEDIEKSRLPVVLLGTFAADEPSLSRATLHDRESNETLVVGIGDEIDDQALVMRIERGRVVLRENGALRELSLDEAEQVTARVTPPSRSARSNDRELARTDGAVQLPDEDGFAPPGTERAYWNRLLSQGRMLPKFEGGQMVGLQISAIESGSLFEEIGLVRGDVITELNGVRADSPEIAKTLQEMSDADEVHLVGRRADGSDLVWDFVPEDG